MRARGLVLLGLLLGLAAVAGGGAVLASATTTPPSLTGEGLNASTVIWGGTCAGGLTFSASGDVGLGYYSGASSIPYPGTFTESGSITRDSGTGKIATWDSTFTVNATDGTVITGTLTLDTMDGTYVNCTGNGAGYAYLDYTATIVTPDGITCTDAGNADVDFSTATSDYLEQSLSSASLHCHSSTPATITVRKALFPSTDSGRFDLRVGSTVVKAGAGDGDSGTTTVQDGTYSVGELPVAPASLADYVTSIACTKNGQDDASASVGHVDVTVAGGDAVDCTITNAARAPTIRFRSVNARADDPAQFGIVVDKGKQGGRGSAPQDTGVIPVDPGNHTIVEVPAPPTKAGDYTTTFSCTNDGKPGPSGAGTTVQLTIVPGDHLDCTYTNTGTTLLTVVNSMSPSDDPGRFDLVVGKTTVKAGAGNGEAGTTYVIPSDVVTGKLGPASALTVAEYLDFSSSPHGYLTSASCTDDTTGASWAPIVVGQSFATPLAPGHHTTCTFRNTVAHQPTIRVSQVFDGPLLPFAGSFAFGYDANAATISSPVGDAGFWTVDAGSHTVVEMLLPDRNAPKAGIRAPLPDPALWDVSVSCTKNGGPGPSAAAATVTVSLAASDVVDCTFTNRQKLASVTLVNHVAPAGDPGTWDMLIDNFVVEPGAGDGVSRTVPVWATQPKKTIALSEKAAKGTAAGTYTTSYSCTVNGVPGPTGAGPKLNISAKDHDDIVCEFFNTKKN